MAVPPCFVFGDGPLFDGRTACVTNSTKRLLKDLTLSRQVAKIYIISARHGSSRQKSSPGFKTSLNLSYLQIIAAKSYVVQDTNGHHALIKSL